MLPNGLVYKSSTKKDVNFSCFAQAEFLNFSYYFYQYAKLKKNTYLPYLLLNNY